ncbi:hydroxyethylthiazole kinase [Geomicrobium sediminis]|uniref:Hydroxyethylthiazole kinase n=1 Tax=Geomicrobium sediminis TaxID=1347788 RepID=A0ABS2PH69_9BACL|nr:hydroxyethylthiazole kinase [Geomicrobium sediminis]MBM7634779.1 hydroxyethylthiazole kinase [Geomicrobium sediminis]
MNENVRETHPLIYCITNDVVMNFTANGLLAVGAAPVMSKQPKEAADLATAANGLLLNMGTLTDVQFEAMRNAGVSANQNNVPIVFDPVAVGATTFRSQSAVQLLEQIEVTVVRGNSGEIASLVGMEANVRGVDGSSAIDTSAIAKKAAKELNTIVCVTGETDAVSDGEQTITITSGHEWLTKVVGTGCLLGAIITAYISTHQENTLEAVASALVDYGLCAEAAHTRSEPYGIGTFQQSFLDELSKRTSNTTLSKEHFVYV